MGGGKEGGGFPGKFATTDMPFVGCNKKELEKLWCCISVTDGKPISNDVSLSPPHPPLSHFFLKNICIQTLFLFYSKKKIINKDIPVDF